MTRKIFIPIFSLIISFLFISFFFIDTYKFIPHLHFEFINYTDQKEFQWIEDNNYYFKNQTIKLDPDYLYSFSILPKGFIRYKKVGSEIEYILPDMQLFWKREIPSYPYMDPWGNFIININADRTKVIVFDINGNNLYTFDGNFLVDLQYSSGKFIIFNKDNYFTEYLEKPSSFLKSFFVMDDSIVFHYYKNNKDFFELYSIKIQNDLLQLKSKKIIESKIIFPYTISFVFSEDQIIFPNFGETIQLKENQIYSYILSPDKKIIEIKSLKDYKEISIETSFKGDITIYKNLIFVIKKSFLEVYDNKGNFLFYIPIEFNKGFFFIKENLYIFYNKFIVKIT